MEDKYLITTDAWFTAPDGKQYKCVWGEVKVFSALGVLGLEPNRNSANWMVRVGTEDCHIILAGCQIHYAVKWPNRPYTGKVTQNFEGADKVTDSQIYIPELPQPTKLKEPIGDIASLEPVYGEWIDSNEKLIMLVTRLSSNYFKPGSEREEILFSIERGNCNRYRYERKPFTKYMTLELKWKNGKIEILKPK